MPRYTLKEIEALARQHDPTAWDSMTAKERREMVAQLNAELDAKATAEAFIRRSLRAPKR
jgi:predicted Fe-S protein YdhL (DUF1289 family)